MFTHTKKPLLCKALDNFEWSVRCWGKCTLDEICMTVSSQVENCSGNSAGVFTEQVSTFVSFPVSSSALLATCCWFYFHHIWNSMCAFFLIDFLHHLCDPWWCSLQYIHVISAGEPTTLCSTPDVPPQAEQRGRMPSLDLLGSCHPISPAHWGHFEWWHNPLVSSLFSQCECAEGALSHHPYHWWRCWTGLAPVLASGHITSHCPSNRLCC